MSQHHVMTLATSAAGPWAAAVFFVNDGFGLYFLSAATTRHRMNLAACPRAVDTIQEDCKDWQQIRGVQLEGPVSELHGLKQRELLLSMVRNFPWSVIWPWHLPSLSARCREGSGIGSPSNPYTLSTTRLGSAIAIKCPVYRRASKKKRVL
ncbi:pyridoxamine 5'-phosphate oxidase family protein [Georgfuchsia toluolica]|uniref:pyridoxamine 5'-phosphate oxidase family protein n=1 Tax=Georgfuchsia toluolica TaxID=424218 RepID=UPI001C730A49|nr:pyridoxamine 5'-phosphate oxidase family protein [Georgfuchsia toluolica]